MKQQYQGASREVQEAEEREGTSEGLIRRLRRTIADQQAASRQQEDQVGGKQKLDHPLACGSGIAMVIVGHGRRVELWICQGVVAVFVKHAVP